MELRAETSVFDDKLLKEDIENAQETADNAQVIAGTTAQYFWFLEEIGSVPAGVGTGAHITNKTKEEFLNNPANGGGNLLARSNGIAIRDGLTELAIFSANQLRIGRANAQRAVVNSGSLELYNAQNNRYFIVSANGMTYGTHTVADTAYADGKASAAQSAAEKVAKDYLYIDGNGALNIASANPSTATRKVNISADGIKIQNDVNNYTLVTSNGMDIYQGGNSAAFFGATARIGKMADTNISVTPADTDSGIKMNVKNSAGTSSVRIADIGFDNSQGYETDYNFPKGAWYTFGYRGGTEAQRGYYSLVAGFNCIASHNASVSFGINNKVYAPCGFAVGMENEVGDSSKTSQNSYTASTIGNCSAAIGYGLKTGSGANQLVCGEYNQVLANQAPFIVGIGRNSSSRRNGFVVQSSGNAILYGTLTQGSDRRLKEHISYLGDDAVEFVNKLKPAFYVKDGEKHVGFYAQDVKEVDKWHCMTGEMNGFMTLGYTEIIAPLVTYCQHLEHRIEELERR